MKYRKANNYPVGLQFNEEFEHNICENTGRPDLCYEYVEPSLLQKASAFSRAVVQWAKSGFPVRSEEEVEKVKELCRACPEYAGERGYFKIFCKKCGCSSKKQWLATEHCPLPTPKW